MNKGKLTDKDLFEFVYRADTPHKVATAERWLKAHKDIMSRATFDNLLQILAEINKRLFLAQMAEYEARIIKYGYEIDTRTGEVFVCQKEVRI